MTVSEMTKAQKCRFNSMVILKNTLYGWTLTILFVSMCKFYRNKSLRWSTSPYTNPMLTYICIFFNINKIAKRFLSEPEGSIIGVFLRYSALSITIVLLI